MYYLALRAENSRRDQGIRDEIIDGINDKGGFIRYHASSCIPLIFFHGVGDSKTVEKAVKLNERFATVEDAKREKGDRWSGYRYIL